MKHSYFSLSILLLVYSGTVFSALKEDSKFIARILGVSDTKRTILVNRGKENGLILNHHAKISTPIGMIARAVVVKVSPSRSVWSVYRFFSKEKIVEQTVATFKIASPVKLTNDESKALGAQAAKVDKKEKPLPKDPKFSKEQERIGLSILRTEKVISQFDDIDYSSLQDDEDVILNLKRDSEIDWSGLDGKRDGENFDNSLDYGALK